MAPNRNKSRSTVRPGGSRVRDARDLLPRKNNSRLNSGVTTKRILKTSQGLVTNKKKKGISTAQLRNRQNQQGGGANLNAFKQRNQRAPQPTRVGVKAAMKRSTMINSNPVLQRVLCFLMPVGTVGSNQSDEKTPAESNVRILDHPISELDEVDTVNNVITKNGKDNNDSGDDSLPDFGSEDTNTVIPSVEEETDSDLDDYELPSTCVALKAPNGSDVYIVGTAHYSLKSQKDVRRVIRSVNPQRVVVELCKERVQVLTMDEKTLLREASAIDISYMRQTISRMGVLQGTMYLLMIQTTVSLTSKLKIVSGGEFRTAHRECLKRRDCQMFLGDREITVTLTRAWASFGLWERVEIIWALLTSTFDTSIEDIESYKDKDFLQQILGETLAEFPTLSRVLLSERDLYLTKSVYDVSMSCDRPLTVVAIVGIGHQRGIVENWENAHNINMAELVAIPKPALSVRIATKAFRLGVFITVGYVVYRVAPSSAKRSLQAGISWGLTSGVQRVQSYFR